MYGSRRSKCYPQTRVAVRNEIMGWIHSENSDVEKILWVSGPAGAGKTAIAGSLAKSWEDQHLLAASFFFSAGSGSPHCQSKARLIPTLAYQLIQHSALDGMKRHMERTIQDNPILFKMSLERQLELLILDPLRKMERRPSTEKWPEIILIDGLDECEGIHLESFYSSSSSQESKDEVHEKILSTLLLAARDPCFPFRIIVVSRPDFAINDFFSRASPDSQRIFLDERYDPDADIAHFVQGKLSDLGRRFALPPRWPPDREQVVRTFVRDASGQFVYVATVIRYMEESKEHPGEALNRILDWDAEKHPSAQSPFKRLDALYMRILQASPDPLLTVTWLHAILELHTEGPGGVAMVKAFLEPHDGEMERLLGCLSSLINVTDTFRFFHKSFLDFLSTESRSGYLYVDPINTTNFLQERWYKILKSACCSTYPPSRSQLLINLLRCPDKGPHIQLNERDRTSFLRYYAGLFTTRYFHLSQNRHYEPNDVQWWTEIACAELTHEREEKIGSMHELVHEKVRIFQPDGEIPRD